MSPEHRTVRVAAIIVRFHTDGRESVTSPSPRDDSNEHNSQGDSS